MVIFRLSLNMEEKLSTQRVRFLRLLANCTNPHKVNLPHNTTGIVAFLEYARK